MAEKLPYFKFYPADFMGSGKVQMMGPVERGIYISLLCQEWQEGPLPDNPTILARVASATPDQMEEAWPLVRRCFSTNEDGELIHPRLEEEREAALDRRRKAQKAARASARVRRADAQASAQADAPADAGADANADAGADGVADGGAWDERSGAPDSESHSSHSTETHSPESTSTPPSESEDSSVVVSADPGSGADPEEPLKANDLVGAWVDRQPSGPSQSEKSKQGAAAKRICENHPRERIVAAFIGMDQLFPHSDGQPWDLFDLERKFSKACEAAMEHPEAKDQVRKAEMMAALEKAG